MMDPHGRTRFGLPPVDEVVFSTQFAPLTAFLTPHYGLLWERFKDDYPLCQEKSPLASIEEQPSGPAVLGIPDVSNSFMHPRLWFLERTGPGLIQVQRSRYLVNWRRRNPEDEYPGFDRVFRRFQKHLEEFEAFLTEHGLGSLAMQQYELTYVNIIPQGAGWKTLTDIGQVVPALSWRTNEPIGTLGMPQAFNWEVAFGLPGNAGRLHVSLNISRRSHDNVPVLRLEFTARGINSDGSRERIWEWFEGAHIAVTRGFRELTGDEVQRTIWQRME